MNKVLFGLAVAAVGSAFAVESSNVVGYANTGARSGNKIIGAQFGAVSAEAIDLTDVKVTGYDPAEGTEAQVKVQSLDHLGKGGMTYSYYDVPGELTGWLDSFDEPIEVGDVTLAPGEGFWVNAPSTAFGLQSAGQVPTSSYSVTLRSGNKMVVNSTPVSVDLINVAVSGYNTEEGTEAQVKVQSLDNLGKGGMTYSFYDVPGELFGWLDSFDEPIEAGDVMIEPGEGLWVNSPSTSFQLEIPGVTL